MEEKKVYYMKDDGVQYHTGIKKGDVGRYVIMPGDPKRCAKIAACLTDAELVADVREFVTYTGMLGDTMVSVTSTGIGGPSASIAVEELAECGADTMIRIGTCGGIALDVQGGDLVIATGAVRMEGTTKEYAPIEYPAVPDLTVTNALVAGAARLNLKAHTGVVQCKDAFYGQHDPSRLPNGDILKQKWEAWKRMGCLASEMESAALFIVGASLGIRTGAVMLCVANQERRLAGLDNPQVEDTGSAIYTAIEAVKLLGEHDARK